MSRPPLTPLTPYQWKLLGFLSVATFFEGFDFMALSQILPNMREEMELSIAQAGILLSVINIGTLVAYVLIRKADAWGRRRARLSAPGLRLRKRADRDRSIVPGGGFGAGPLPGRTAMDEPVRRRDYLAVGAITLGVALTAIAAPVRSEVQRAGAMPLLVLGIIGALAVIPYGLAARAAALPGAVTASAGTRASVSGTGPAASISRNARGLAWTTAARSRSGGWPGSRIRKAAPASITPRSAWTSGALR